MISDAALLSTRGFHNSYRAATGVQFPKDGSRPISADYALMWIAACDRKVGSLLRRTPMDSLLVRISFDSPN